jgi:pimeloyl-ACP methyl ester carboxylesterase
MEVLAGSVRLKLGWKDSLHTCNIARMIESRRSILNVEGDLVSIRHSLLLQDRPTVLLLHGLGDSSLAFEEAFTRGDFSDFNFVAPDLPGHGRSPAAHNGSYRLEALANRVAALIEIMSLRRLTVVAHSMGGDIAVVLASSSQFNRIERIVSVEGALTPADLFICNRASRAGEQGFGAFETWFREKFCQQTVFEGWAREGEAGRRYYASLRFCDPAAFLACAIELCLRNQDEDVGGLNGIGTRYAALPVEKHFVYGTKSLPETSKRLLAEVGLKSYALPAGHWVMIDAASEFYPLLRQLIPI